MNSARRRAIAASFARIEALAGADAMESGCAANATVADWGDAYLSSVEPSDHIAANNDPTLRSDLPADDRDGAFAIGLSSGFPIVAASGWQRLSATSHHLGQTAFSFLVSGLTNAAIVLALWNLVAPGGSQAPPPSLIVDTLSGEVASVAQTPSLAVATGDATPQKADSTMDDAPTSQPDTPRLPSPLERTRTAAPPPEAIADVLPASAVAAEPSYALVVPNRPRTSREHRPTLHPSPAAAAVRAVAAPPAIASLVGLDGTKDLAVPRILQNPTTYPEAAFRQGLSGTTWVEADVTAGGSVSAVRLWTSSGHELLDAAALRDVRRWRFRPRRIAGHDEAMTVLVFVRYRP